MSEAQFDKDKDHDTEESDFDIDFKLEPLPCAADIIAELPDYPDSEEEEEVRSIMQMISVSNSSSMNLGDQTNEDSKSELKEKIAELKDDYPSENAFMTKEKEENDDCVDKNKDESLERNADKSHESEQEMKDGNDIALDDADEVNLIIDRSQLECSLIDIDSRTDSPEQSITDESNLSKKRLITSPVQQKKSAEVHLHDALGSNFVRKSKRQRIEAPKTSELKLDKKVYLNKAGEFFTGFDPASAEAKYRRQMRMQRFGKYEKIEKSKFDDSKLDISDCHSDENSEVMFEKRPEAIHLFGTDDLSTDDILEYFSEFSPHHIEWVDDSHCNVVWSDVHSVKRALLSLSKKYTEEELEELKKELRMREKDEDGFYLVPGSLDRPGNDEYKGMWRIAIKDNHKAHLMFMRIANIGDIKKRGAYKNSRYYSLYGNPNAPYLPSNDYTKLKQNQSKRQLESKKTNMEMKEMTVVKPPDLRRYLKKGSIDVEQIKEEYKVGKPLIETLTIEVDRSEIVTDVEVRKDNSDSGSEVDQPSEDNDSRTVEKRPSKRSGGSKKAAAVILHSSSSSESSSESDSESSSSSSSSSSDSSDSESSDSSSSDSSEKSEVEVKKANKSSKKLNSESKKMPSPRVKSHAKKRIIESIKSDIKAARLSKKSTSKTVVSVPRKPHSTKSVAVIRPTSKSSERPKHRKLSSQIKPVTNNGTVTRKEVVIRRKRRGRTPVSPHNKRARVLQPTLDLRTKIAGRSR